MLANPKLVVMRIVHIGKYYPPIPGGIETVVRDIAVEQVRQGHRVWVLSHWDRAGHPSTKEVIGGVNVLRIPIKAKVAYTPLAPSFPQILDQVLCSVQPDVVHVHLPNVAPFWLLKYKRCPPVVIHWHSDVLTSLRNVRLTLFYPGYAFFQRRLLTRAAAVIATSREYLEKSRPLHRVRGKCIVVPLGLDSARMNPVPQVDVNKAKPLVVSAGRFTYYKGFDVLIRAASRLPSQVEVVIAGEGEMRPRLQREIHRLGLEHQVSLPGRVSDRNLHTLMGQCRLFCLPSVDKTEAFGMVLLEAMYYARPLVSTRVPGSGMQQVNEHGVTGLNVSPGDPHDLAAALDFFIRNPYQAQLMGARGKEQVETKYHIALVVRRLIQLYEPLKDL
ncbi:MAG: glycosyltransferase [Desulfovermiculus sp.]|nr:glycosyltransferase [Desulfovermiculus sp.]